jgi:hypothetical protein
MWFWRSERVGRRRPVRMVVADDETTLMQVDQHND